MNKIAIKTLSFCATLCAVFAFALPKATVFNTQNLVTANAETGSATLLAPSSYQSYLPLTNTKDVAASEQFTAIADGKTLYVYDSYDNDYSIYVHSEEITKIQFDKRELLYFLDDSTHVYTLNPTRMEKQETSIVCSTFYIAEDTFYYTNTSGNTSILRKKALNDLEDGQPTTLVKQIASAPSFAFERDELYYTDGKILFKINPAVVSEPTPIAIFPSLPVSISIADNILTCATIEGEFMVFDLLNITNNTLTPLYKKDGGFSAVSLHKELVYTVNGNAVQAYSLKDEAFTSYEITSSSNSLTRINNAVDVCVSDERLFLADNGNERISVYDLSTSEFLAPISTSLQPERLASNDKTVLAVNKTEVVLFDLSKNGYGNELLRYAKNLEGNIVGVTSVFDSYYVLTDKNQFIHIEKQNGTWTATQTKKTSTKYPSLLASDAIGNLYVRCNDSVYKYTEEEFMHPVASTLEILSELPERTTKLCFDYSGNLYAFSEKTLYKYTPSKEDKENYSKSEEILLDKSYVCNVEKASPVSVALSLKENATYVLDANHYLIKTEQLQLPTLQTIPVNGSDETILKTENKEFSIVEIQQNALLVQFDFSALKGAEYFPFQDYIRTGSALKAVQLGSTERYNAVAVFDETKKCYNTYLVDIADCKQIPMETLSKTYTEPEQRTAYLSNAVSLSCVPYLSSQLSIAQMQRGESVVLLGELNGLSLEYYLVRYETENGETKTGYVPKKYVTFIRSETPSQNQHQGKEEPNADSVWRLIYLLLGFGVICILTDFLILRYKKQNKD